MAAPLTSPPRAVLTRITDGGRIEIGDTATAGRLDECDIRLTQGHASRTHARLTFRDGSLYVEDLRSANGTFVNGVRVLAPVRVQAGDRVRFDVEEFTVTFPTPSSAGRAALPTSAAPAWTNSSQTVFEPSPPLMTVGQPILKAPEPAPAPAPAKPSAPAARPTPAYASPPAAAPPAKVIPPTAPFVEPPVPAAPPARVTPPAATPPARATAPARATPPGQPAARPDPKPAATAAKAANPGGASDGGGQKRPGAWADTMAGQKGGGKSTKYIAPGELADLMESSSEALAAASPALDQPHLQVMTGRKQGSNIPLSGRGNMIEWSVGSDAQRDVVLPDDGVSAFHARLINDGRRWKVIDQMSANGTFVNGKRGSVTYLSFGDRLAFGPTECVFQAPVDEVSRPGSRARWVVSAIAAATVLFVLLMGWRMLRG